jgi:aspartyl-tRNA synthetase
MDAVYTYSAEGKPLSKKALKKQQKDAEKAKRRAATAAKLVHSL